MPARAANAATTPACAAQPGCGDFTDEPLVRIRDPEAGSGIPMPRCFRFLKLFNSEQTVPPRAPPTEVTKAARLEAAGRREAEADQYASRA
jgi:hypothetical protein